MINIDALDVVQRSLQYIIIMWDDSAMPLYFCTPVWDSFSIDTLPCGAIPGEARKSIKHTHQYIGILPDILSLVCSELQLPVLSNNVLYGDKHKNEGTDCDRAPCNTL